MYAPCNVVLVYVVLDKLGIMFARLVLWCYFI